MKIDWPISEVTEITFEAFSLYCSLILFGLTLCNLLLWIARAGARTRAERLDREFQKSLRTDMLALFEAGAQ